MHEVEDVGSNDYLDLSSFTSLDDEECAGEGRQVTTAEEAKALLERATASAASPERG